jgi:hypothetical protein
MQVSAGAVAGVIGGLVMSVAMAGGRRGGLLEKTLAEESEDWLDQKFHTRSHVGDLGTTAIEQADHMLAAAAFGMTYAKARSYVTELPWAIAGALFGALLYVVNIVGIAPLLGITRGEWQAPARIVGQRLSLHLVFGAVTALAFELLADERGRLRFPHHGSRQAVRDTLVH